MIRRINSSGTLRIHSLSMEQFLAIMLHCNIMGRIASKIKKSRSPVGRQTFWMPIRA